MKYQIPIVSLVLVSMLSGCSLVRSLVHTSDPTPACPAVEVAQCAAPVVIEKIVEVPAAQATTAGALHLPIIGGIEWASVAESGLVMEARVDTGAETSSIHAEEIQLVERDGRRYIRFFLVDVKDGSRIPMERRLRRRVLIKQHDDESQQRYVVKLWIALGKSRAQIEVTLIDRSEFEYPLLIGRNFLVDAAIVDVSRHHTLTK